MTRDLLGFRGVVVEMALALVRAPIAAAVGDCVGTLLSAALWLDVTTSGRLVCGVMLVLSPALGVV